MRQGGIGTTTDLHRMSRYISTNFRGLDLSPTGGRKGAIMAGRQNGTIQLWPSGGGMKRLDLEESIINTSRNIWKIL